MTPSDKLRELAELSEKATQGEWENARGFVRSRLPTTGMLGSNIEFQTACTWVAETTEGEGYVPDNGNAAFIAALVNWYRTEGRQLAEDGLRYRWLRADIARGGTQIGYLPKYLTHVASPDMMDAAVDALIDAARGEIT